MWERFCRCYVDNRELFGNATRSYAEANNIKLDELPDDDEVYESVDDGQGEMIRKKVKSSTYDRTINICAVNGNTLLRKPNIDKRVKQLLKELFVEDVADSEMAWVMAQRVELGPKISAIKEFNALKGRIVKKVALTDENGESIFDDETKNKRKEALKGYLARRRT